MSELSFRIILRVSALEHLLVFMSYDSMISSSTTSTIWRNRELRHGISKILIYRQVVVYWDSVPDGSLNDPFLNKCDFHGFTDKVPWTHLREPMWESVD